MLSTDCDQVIHRDKAHHLPGGEPIMKSSTEPERVVQSEFFAGVTERDKRLILRAAKYRKIDAKSVLFQGGTTALHLFLLCSGGAKYYRMTRQGGELLLRWLVPGDIFGIGAFVKEPVSYIGSAQATEDCGFYVWAHSTLRELAGIHPQISDNALRITLAYLATFIERHASSLTITAEQRLAHTLLQLGHQAGRSHSLGAEVAITNEELGSLADVSQFTTCRLLSRWKKQGAIAKLRGRVIIQSPEKLLVD